MYYYYINILKLSYISFFLSRFEANLDIEGTNHYSVPNRRASQAFNDPDELLLDDRNPDAVSQCCVEDNASNRYANAMVLSSSYDERLFHKEGELVLIGENVSDCSYDKHSIVSNGVMSCVDSSYQLPMNCDISKQDKYIHSHSENSLHRQRANSLHHKLEQMHISEPELNLSVNKCENNIPHTYNVPLLRNILRPTSTILPANTSEYCTGVSNQSINQVAELIQASVLLQDNKWATSSSCLEHCSPKAKTKEWVETSLDSPIVTKKRKPKQSDCSPTIEHCQQGQWLENGLPPTYSSDPYYGYQAQAKYTDDMNLSSNSIPKFRRSPSPVQHQYNPAGCPVDCRNISPKIVYSQVPSERIYVNSNHLMSDGSIYHHYENTAELPGNCGNLTSQQSNLCYENGNYNSNFENSISYNVPNSEQPGIPFDDVSTPKLGIAEPQQPSKHHNRRIKTDEVFPPENHPCLVPDYQNIPMDNQYDAMNYRDVNSCDCYAQVQCDVPDSGQFLHNHPVYHDGFNVTSDSQQAQNWQQPVVSTAVENPAVSPVSQNVNFSPTVVNVVSPGHFQPYWEETKPYELSDFYKYSTKHRKQQKNNTNDVGEMLTLVEKEGQEVSHQYYEQSHRENTSAAYREYHYPDEIVRAQNVKSPLNQHQELVTSHVPVFDSSEQLESPAK